LDHQTRRRFFRNYVQTVTRRDVPEISRIQHVDELPRLLSLLAASTGQEIHDARLAGRLSIDRRTLRANYLPLLETTYLTLQVGAWSRNMASRVAKHPKGYLVDSGLAAHLLKVDPNRLAAPTAVSAGPLIESFAVNELVRQASRFADELAVTLYHFRAHGGGEIDLIAETDDGRIAGIEVKSAQTVQAKDFAELARVRDRVDRLKDLEFKAGIVLYTGKATLSFGDRLQALPMAALWSPL